MAIGEFRHRAVFSVPSSVPDEFGVIPDTLTAIATVGVQISQLSGNDREFFTRGVATTEDFINVTTRWKEILSNINKNGKVDVNGRRYAIVGLNRLNDRGQFIRFTLREDR